MSTGRINLSQGDIEERTGLLRCYISRVENGHTVPTIETLEKMAHAMQMHLYQVLYERDLPPSPLAKRLAQGKWGSSGKSARYFLKLTNYLSRMDSTDRLLLLGLAKEVAKRARGRQL
jgi:transcriptional regulator with XRE-family HTH domain